MNYIQLSLGLEDDEFLKTKKTNREERLVKRKKPKKILIYQFSIYDFL